MVDIKRVSPREARALMEAGYTYVDVRSEQEFDLGHPSGAVNVPFQRLGPSGMGQNPEFLAVMSAAFPREAKLLVGCRTGNRSHRAAQVLLAAGFQNVVDQRAGVDGVLGAFGAVLEPGWAGEGLPIEKGAPPGTSYEEIKVKSPSDRGDPRGAG